MPLERALKPEVVDGIHEIRLGELIRSAGDNETIET